VQAARGTGGLLAWEAASIRVSIARHIFYGCFLVNSAGSRPRPILPRGHPSNDPERVSRGLQPSRGLLMRVTLWRLTDLAGTSAECAITERDGAWHLVVRRGAAIMLADRCPTDDAALARANDIGALLVEQGWRELWH
jgi:hypothetical protein